MEHNIQLVELPQEERFINKIVKNAEEAVELIENGYDYVIGEYKDGRNLFRKQKWSFIGSSSNTAGSWSSMDSHPSGDITRFFPANSPFFNLDIKLLKCASFKNLEGGIDFNCFF